jgi:hypothetical protein
MVKHHRSHERRGDIPGIPPAPPSRRGATAGRTAAASSTNGAKEEAEEENKTLVCDVCAGVYSTEKALSLHLRDHKHDIVCGVEGCQEIFRSARLLKEHKASRSGRKREKRTEIQCFFRIVVPFL